MNPLNSIPAAIISGVCMGSADHGLPF